MDNQNKGLGLFLALGAAVVIGIPLLIWYAYPAWTESAGVDMFFYIIAIVVGYIFFGSIGGSVIITVLMPFYASTKTKLTDESLKLYKFLGFISIIAFLFTDFGAIVLVGSIIASIARFNYDKTNFPEK